MAYLGMYKCRLCGNKYMRVSVPSSDDVVQQFICMTTPDYYKLCDNMHQRVFESDMHDCGNGNYGFADFLGFEKED